MAGLQVWAPAAKRVEVQLADRTYEMKPAGGGWWDASDANVRHGDEYAFSIDGGKALPDPRSPWQPNGVHSASRAYLHSEYRWRDRGWRAPPVRSGVAYELHIGTFSPEGTFDGAEARLDHLVDLGVTHVELLPVNSFAGPRGWGYDGVDLWAPHEPYGGPDGLKRFVDACHQKGLAVILDVVYNHLGPEGNYLAQFGPYFAHRYSTPWGDAVNLDGAGSDEVRRFFIQNALMWLRDYHVDALRVDAVHAIYDQSATHFVEELSLEVARLECEVGRPLEVIGESDLNDPRIVTPREAGGFGMDAQWSDDFHHSLHALITGETSGYYSDFGRMADLAKALTEVFVYDGRYSRHRGRRHGRPPLGLEGWRFVCCIQNHDQVGNRARGERLAALVSPGRLKIAAALVLTSPFVPMLFMGEEWGATTPFQYFSSFPDADLGRAVSEGRRREFASFGWRPEDVPDPQDPATFERSRLDWNEVSRPHHAELLEWYRGLIRLRRASPDLADGRLDRLRADFSEEERWLAVERGRFTIAANLSESERVAPLFDAVDPVILLASEDSVGIRGDGVTLPPNSVTIVQRCGD